MKRDEIRRANHAVYQVNYHLVWIPKRRKQVLVGAVADRLREICVEVAQEHGWTILNLAIKPDHVHLFVEATTKEAPHEIVRAFKGRSSRILRQEFPHLLKLPSLWTHSYFCRTAGNVSAAVIKAYLPTTRVHRRAKPMCRLSRRWCVICRRAANNGADERQYQPHG